MTSRKLLFPFFLLFLPCTQAAELGPGDIDPDFGDQSLRMGVQVFPGYGNHKLGHVVMALQGSGHLLVGWESCTAELECRFRMQRVSRNDGMRDTGFLPASANELVIASMLSGSVRLAVDVTDRIWISYSRSMELAANDTRIAQVVQRFGADGSPDTGFGDAGSITLLPDNNAADLDEQFLNQAMLVMGDSAWLARHVADDPSQQSRIEILAVDSGGIHTSVQVDPLDGVYTSAMDFAAYRDGRVLLLTQYNGLFGLSTYEQRLYRFLPDGTLDGSFGDNGVVSSNATMKTGFESLYSVKDLVLPFLELDSEERPLLAGYLVILNDSDWRPLIMRPVSLRLSAGGALDPGYGGDPVPGILLQAEEDRAVSALVAMSDSGRHALITHNIFRDSYGGNGVVFLDGDGAADLAWGGNPASGEADARTQPIAGGFTRRAVLRDENDAIFFSLFEYSLEGVGVAPLEIGRLLGAGESRLVDLEPDYLPLEDITGVPDGECISATPFTVSGVDTAVGVHAENGHVGVNSWQYTSEATLVSPGDEIRLMACGYGKQPEEVTTVNVTLGELSGSYRYTVADYMPDAMNFPAVTDAPLDEFVVSGEILVSGLETSIFALIGPTYDEDVAASVNGGEFRRYIELDPSVEQRLRLRLRSARSEGREKFATILLQTTSGEVEVGRFTVTTARGASPEEPTSSGGGGAPGLAMLLLLACLRRRAGLH